MNVLSGLGFSGLRESSMGTALHGKLVSSGIGLEAKNVGLVSPGPVLVIREGLEAKSPDPSISRAWSHVWTGSGTFYHQVSLLSPSDFQIHLWLDSDVTLSFGCLRASRSSANRMPYIWSRKYNHSM